ncbi:unnamed protein product [Didymodactylos carnosus]|uniref:MAM domain-containing protein n=1 Tax=Didymodactylos carnosus TaxID=1234261 RepID=A0A813U7J8_9BILA|nr:unnamed protein product [Didymodactylos carnosus]CAF3605911.1 unnamed protein product [Didymodactylos carnosus]
MRIHIHSLGSDNSLSHLSHRIISLVYDRSIELVKKAVSVGGVLLNDEIVSIEKCLDFITNTLQAANAATIMSSGDAEAAAVTDKIIREILLLNEYSINLFNTMTSQSKMFLLRVTESLLINTTTSPLTYNESCTFSNGTCEWLTGRRWHTGTLTDNDKLIDEVVLIMIGDELDREQGFTEALRTIWLPPCSTINLSFKFLIRNPYDTLTVYVLNQKGVAKKMGEWLSLTNTENFTHNRLIWQYANLTMAIKQIHRVEIEARHFPNSNSLFAIDDLLLMSQCHSRTIETNTIPISSTSEHTTTHPIFNHTNLMEPKYTNILRDVELVTISSYVITSTPIVIPSSSTLYGSSISADENNRLSILTLVLYLLCSIIVFILLLVLVGLVVFIYKKRCFIRHDSVSAHLEPKKKNLINIIQIEDVDNSTNNNPNTTSASTVSL